MFLAALIAATVLAAPDPSTASSKAPAIVAVADSYAAAVLKGDATAVGRLYVDDAIEMAPAMAPIKGRAAIQDYYGKLFGGPGKVTALTLDHIESRMSGDIGYDAGTYHQTMSQPPAGVPADDTGKYVVVLKRVGGQWKVAYAIYNSDQPPAPAPASMHAH